MWTQAGTSLAYFYTALCASFLLLFVVFRRKKVKTCLDTLPGPRQYFLGNYLNLLEIADRRKSLKVMLNWTTTFMEKGHTVGKLDVGPFSMVAIISPDHIQRLLGSLETKCLGKPFLIYGVFKPVHWFDGIVNSKGDKWKSRRKLLNPTFSYSSLLGYIPALNEYGKRLVDGLETQFEDSTPQPIYSILFATALSVLLRTTFGVDVSDKNGPHAGYISSLVEGTKRFFEIVVIRIVQPWLGYEPIFKLHPLSKELNAFYETSSQFVRAITEEVSRSGGAVNNNGNSLLRDLTRSGLSNKEIYEETVTALMAGFETSGTALHSLLFLLALHPQFQERCREEVDSVFDSEDFCVDGNITAKGLKQLQYLEQCLMESIRLLPPIPVIARELSGNLTLEDGLEIPAGTTVAVWLLGLHRNPELYPNPEKFDPDRFTPEARKTRLPYSYIPFAAGPRTCIGNKYATMELLIMAAHVIRHFRLQTTDRLEDVVWLPHLTMMPETAMKFVLERRKL